MKKIVNQTLVVVTNMGKIQYTNTNNIVLEGLSSNHNLGVISDTAFNTFQNAYNNIHTSYTTSVFIGLKDNKQYLSFSNKKFEPVIGNRISKFVNNDIIYYYYLIMDLNGQLITKKLLTKI